MIQRGPAQGRRLKFIKCASQPELEHAAQATFISYGSARKSSAPMVGKFKDGTTDMGPHMPTNPEYMADSLTTDIEFWADHDIELSERFNAWLAS